MLEELLETIIDALAIDAEEALTELTQWQGTAHSPTATPLPRQMVAQLRAFVEYQDFKQMMISASVKAVEEEEEEDLGI